MHGNDLWDPSGRATELHGVIHKGPTIYETLNCNVLPSKYMTDPYAKNPWKGHQDIQEMMYPPPNPSHLHQEVLRA
jgi:hypothetical protein